MPTGRQRQDWEDLSALDPYWAILSEPGQRFGRGDHDAFLESGSNAVDAILDEGAELGLPLARHYALDFGCGAGRLTQALSRHFDRCLGLDISEIMINEARRIAADIPNCEFIAHHESSLAPLGTSTFDLVVCELVLQHVPERDTKARLITEFIRVLRPGGLLALQLPSWIPLRHRIQVRPRVYALLRNAGLPRRTLYRYLRLHPIRMSFVARARVIDLIEAAGGQTLGVRNQTGAGGVVSTYYLATKRT
ncbi:MAG: hypothetical protein QOI89_529 [Solirubrobacteraceae bacterium]|jgi:SAM-dependent methyltransferase|nr:hypothetical protein [Solirubrobacteraceae bacterium]